MPFQDALLILERGTGEGGVDAERECGEVPEGGIGSQIKNSRLFK